MCAFLRHGFEVSVSIEFSDVICALCESRLTVRMTLVIKNLYRRASLLSDSS